MNKPFAKIDVVDSTKVPSRTFSVEELAQIKKLKTFMSTAKDVSSWNTLREQAKGSFDEKIVTAVDGLRKWMLHFNKDTKTRELACVKF